MIKRLKTRLLNWLIKHLYAGLTTDDVFKIVKEHQSATKVTQAVYLGDNKLSDKRALAYKDGAEKLLSNPIWQDICKQVKLASNQRMFDKSVTSDDMIFGKAMLYNLDLVNKYIDLLAKLKL